MTGRSADRHKGAHAARSRETAAASADALGDDDYYVDGSEDHDDDGDDDQAAPLQGTPGPEGGGTGRDPSVPRRSAKREAPTAFMCSDRTRKKPKKKSAKDAVLDFSAASSETLAKWFKQLLRSRTGLSAFEMGERGFGDDAFQDTSLFDGVRGLAGFSSFVNFCMHDDAARLKKPPNQKEVSRPVVIVVCSSAIRAADVIKSLDEFRKECAVAKLFAKHMKVEDQMRFLKSTPVNIAVGNPNRLCKLFESGALGTGRLRKVIVDSTHKDPKGLSIWDLRECEKDMTDLFLNHMASRFREGAAKVVCF